MPRDGKVINAQGMSKNQLVEGPLKVSGYCKRWLPWFSGELANGGDEMELRLVDRKDVICEASCQFISVKPAEFLFL